MISVSDEYQDKMKYLEWANWKFHISTGDYTKGKARITARDFIFYNSEWIEKKIKKEREGINQ